MTAPKTAAAAPCGSDPASLELAVISGKLNAAAARSDMVQTLVSLAALDRMARSLGPQQQAAAEHARDVVAQAITALETALEQDRAGQRISRASHKGSARAAYAAAAAAAR